MTDLRPSEHRKLVGILNRLSSDQDGERLAAAHTANEFLARKDLCWSDVLKPCAAERDGFGDDARNPWRPARDVEFSHWPDGVRPSGNPKPDPVDFRTAHQSLAKSLLGSKVTWDDYDLKFIRQMVCSDRPSEKQKQYLDRLHKKAVDARRVGA